MEENKTNAVNAETTQEAVKNTETKATPATASIDYDKLVNGLESALENRTKRIEKSVVKSYAEQYGLSTDEIEKILTEKQKENQKAIPAEVQAQIDAQLQKANQKLINAELKAQCSEMGVSDISLISKLLDKDNIKIDDNGTVSGIKEQLEELAKNPALNFKPKETGQKASIGAKITTNNTPMADSLKSAIREQLKR